MRKLFALLLASALLCCHVAPAPAQTKNPAGRWSKEKAKEWAEKRPWLVGCNYIPATAINQPRPLSRHWTGSARLWNSTARSSRSRQARRWCFMTETLSSEGDGLISH